MTFEDKVVAVIGKNRESDMAMASTGVLSYLECLALTPDEDLRSKINEDFSVWLEVFRRTSGHDWNDVREAT